MPNEESVSLVRKTITQPTYASESPVLTYQASSSVHWLRGKASPNHAESTRKNCVPPLGHLSPSRPIGCTHHVAQATFHALWQNSSMVENQKKDGFNQAPPSPAYPSTNIRFRSGDDTCNRCQPLHLYLHLFTLKPILTPHPMCTPPTQPPPPVPLPFFRSTHWWKRSRNLPPRGLRPSIITYTTIQANLNGTAIPST